jgi:protein-disulfide isomerase
LERDEMSDRAGEKRQRREERERRAAAEASADRRRRRLWLLGGVVAAAALVVVVLALASGGGDDEGPQGLGDGSSLNGQAEVNRLFAGIPQRGIALGDPDAPVTVVEFVDLQCPFCAQFAREELPELVRRHVRTGDVRLELRLLTFLGEDSLRAGRVAAAAAEQDRGWQFADLFFANQGRENSGYATDEFLRQVAEGVEGLDADRALADAEKAAATAQLRRAAAAAETLGVASTPTFVAGPTGGRLEPLQIAELTADAVGAEIERIGAR